jgi:hypothetical protein
MENPSDKLGVVYRETGRLGNLVAAVLLDIIDLELNLAKEATVLQPAKLDLGIDVLLQARHFAFSPSALPR